MHSGRFDFIKDLADATRQAVLSHLPDRSAKGLAGVAFSGDQTFGIDKVAEEALFAAAETCRERLAIFSEDRGLVKLDPHPEWLLIADPIDGTRPAVCGFESAVVSIALCRYSEVATFDNLIAGIILEIKEGYSYFAEAGCGVEIERPDFSEPRCSGTGEPRQMFWSFETIGRPLERVTAYLRELIDESGMQGASFIFNSSAFSLTRIVTGQLDAHIDVGGRILRDAPDCEADFRAIGNGQVIGTFPYDIAAAYVILIEAGGVITDAFGDSLGRTLVMQHGKEAIISCVAAGNAGLHAKLLKSIAHTSVTL